MEYPVVWFAINIRKSVEVIALSFYHGWGRGGGAM
jgi:hypothetical protein